MKKLVIKSVLFCLPFALFWSLILLVDPYEYFNYSNYISREDKLRTAAKLNYALWKLIHYKRDPRPNILLGDSRMNAFSVDTVWKISGMKFANLAQASTSLDEICATFWEANSITNLRNVYIGLNLNVFNAYNARNRFEGVKVVLANPLLYIVNQDTIHATYLLIKSQFTTRVLKRNTILDIERPEMTRDAFWRFQLEITASAAYANYSRPTLQYLKLQKISQYCRQKGIKLVFIIPATHEDLQKKARSLGLTEAADIFRKDLALLGRVYDFDWSNDLTEERENFADPFHLRTEKVDIMIEEIWGRKLKYAKIYQ